MRVTYLGQACTLIESSGRKLLTDPWLTEGAYFGTWYHTHLLTDAGITPERVAGMGIDYLFLSHEHHDHVDHDSLRAFGPDIPVLICKFRTPRFRRYLESMGLRNIRELNSGEPVDLGDGLRVTVFISAEYTNDSAILVEADGVRVFNETDCKLGFADLEAIAQKELDIGFYMFSGANWYPMAYDFADDVQRAIVQRRRTALVRGFLKRVEITRPRFAVPSAGPCTVLDPDRLWFNSTERGIFIDPRDAVAAMNGGPSAGLYMAASDVWDSRTGHERRCPGAFLGPRLEYIADASSRMSRRIREAMAAEPPAQPDLGDRLARYFNAHVGVQTPAMRQRLAAKVALQVSGPNGGAWTVDFTAPGPDYVRPGIDPDWTYRIEAEDKLLYPFVSGEMEFLEDLFLSLRVRFSRRPDRYSEPLYHFFYDPDPRRLHDWYATH
jgi:UDP-MurNAc hydroxylase